MMLSDSDSSSSTEKDFSTKTYSPNTIRRRKSTEVVKVETKIIQVSATTTTTTTTVQQHPRGSSPHSIASSKHDHSLQESDEDATLNEVMGKFDESYVYEKETDILRFNNGENTSCIQNCNVKNFKSSFVNCSDDSDQTNCPSDLDTGQDAEDECDTDEFLDIDYIDTGSIQVSFLYYFGYLREIYFIFNFFSKRKLLKRMHIKILAVVHIITIMRCQRNDHQKCERVESSKVMDRDERKN